MNKFCYLLIFTLFVSQNSFGSIKKVELTYNKSDVYAGNYFKVFLNVTNDKGETYKSFESRKFDCSKFEINVKNGGTKDTYNEKYFSILVDELKTDWIEIEVKSKLDQENKFFFKIPVYDYVHEIKSINAYLPPGDIISNSEYDLNIVTKLQDGSFYNVKSGGKINFTDFKISVLRGGELINDEGRIRVYSNNACDSILELKIGIRNDDSIFFVRKYLIKSRSRIELDLRTKIELTPNDLILKLDLVYNECEKDSLLEIKIFDKNNFKKDQYYLNLNEDLLIINVSGKDGENGKDGRNGKNSVYSINGENGRDGENGGDAGDVYVYYTNLAEKYYSKVIIINDGGKAGRYGKAGRGIRITHLDNIIYGIDGIPGRDGIDGKDGHVYYILTND